MVVGDVDRSGLQWAKKLKWVQVLRAGVQNTLKKMVDIARRLPAANDVVARKKDIDQGR